MLSRFEGVSTGAAHVDADRVIALGEVAGISISRSDSSDVAEWLNRLLYVAEELDPVDTTDPE
jgi:hypothetical protein